MWSVHSQKKKKMDLKNDLALGFPVGEGPTGTAVPRNLFGLCNLRPHSRPTESESAFLQDFWMFHMYVIL